jgi:hypothetical protein
MFFMENLLLLSLVKRKLKPRRSAVPPGLGKELSPRQAIS